MSVRNDKSYTIHDVTSVFVEDQHVSVTLPKVHLDANINLPSTAAGVMVLSGTLIPDDIEVELTVDEFLDQEWDRHEAALRYLADR